MKNFHLGLGPFIKSNNKTRNIMTHLMIALMPIIIFSFYKNGIVVYLNNKTNLYGLFYPLIFILVGAFTTFLVELLYGYLFLDKRKEELKKFIKNSYSIFPGLFLALILPINTPLYVLVFGCVIATIIGKMLFGGFGNNIFNPALIGCLFIAATYSIVISTNGGYLNNYEIDGIASATPLSNVVEGIGTYDTKVAPYGNLFDFFIGTIPGALGETSTLLCLVAFVYLSLMKVIKWKIPLIYVATVFVMTYIIGTLNDVGIWYPLFQIMSGGLMFGAVFMATDPVTSPTTSIGQILYGLFLGILTVIFRYLTPYPEGVMTSILTMNMLVFIIDRIGSRARFNFNYSLLPFIIAWILIIACSIYIGNSFKVEPNDTDPNFNVVEQNISGNKGTYIVTQKGFSGPIKAEIIIDNNKIQAINILEHNESYYQKVIDNNYIDRIIDEQNNLENIDTVSGATISSTAIKKMVINTYKLYQGEINEK